MTANDPLRVTTQPVRFTADDGVALAGTWFTPSSSRALTAAVVVACGAGIPARFYIGLAHYVASRGAAVLTFDYRGIGLSREGSLRGAPFGMDDWALRDLSAALAQARTAHAELPLDVVAHSVGTMLVGAAEGAAEVSRAVFLGAHTGYWRDYRARWRLPLLLTWHGVVPTVTALAGYFPGRALKLGEDLPRQVAFDWARRLRPALVRSRADQRRFGPYMSRYADFRAATLAISISDDAFAPAPAASRLLAMYPNIAATREIVTPSSVGARRLGHFGFVRRASGEPFWRRTADWLLDAR